ncbi:Ribosomal protein S5 domain 2-type fold protein [Moelleriella libera RCEF 2490]|uniref:Ribosomal protein S5 domain 2-type fold protein n=1 Tax=Moelleriella libera RCEF 2490 TaxID=1081109 RepID=A0A166PL67_9HYPO|nr:Ribosomal protein S5 domain 2-type fold protein [Moelleriella libera RCEF 2490]
MALVVIEKCEVGEGSWRGTQILCAWLVAGRGPRRGAFNLQPSSLDDINHESIEADLALAALSPIDTAPDMAAQGDLQELLRMLTSRKVPMMTAMGHIKALQAKNLRTIEQIAEAPLSSVEAAIPDAKIAKSFHAACKSHGKKATKRAAEANVSPEAKKTKLEPHKRDLDYGSMSADELESSLVLPAVTDEAAIRQTTIVTNRAPLVLAFAVEVLRFTMPEQPPSSRLSLGQALVSANSRSKAVSIGIDKTPLGDGEQIPEGQPKVKVLGREIPVLKRGGYVWYPDKPDHEAQASSSASNANTEAATTEKKTWTASQKLSSKASTFVARAINLSSPSMRTTLMKGLMADRPELETASHNAWALRSSYGNSPLVQEASFDDGESGCGKFLLGIMREADVTNTLVVLTRWYGGVMLGPDRWRLMRECVNDALSSRRRTSTLSGEALWGLDAENRMTSQSTVGMPIHRPEGARNYMLRSFASAPSPDGGATESKRTLAAVNEEKHENLGRLLGAIRLLLASWSGVLSRDELDRRAWSWYVAIRPDVEAGPSGWGAKGNLHLGKILDLRRQEQSLANVPSAAS